MLHNASCEAHVSVEKITQGTENLFVSRNTTINLGKWNKQTKHLLNYDVAGFHLSTTERTA